MPKPILHRKRYSRTHLYLLPLNAPPLHKQTPNSRQASHHKRNLKDLSQCRIILLHDTRHILRRHDTPKTSRTRQRNLSRVHARHVFTDIANHPIRKHALPHRDEHRRAKELQEKHERRRDGDLGDVEDGLDHDLGLLEPEADAEAHDYLISDPFGVAGLEVKGREEARADGRQRGAGEHEGGVVARFGDEGAGENGAEDAGDEEGDVPDAGLVRADALDGLEPDGQVVDYHEEGGAHAESEDARGPDAAFPHHARVDGCGVRSPELDDYEEQEADARDDEEGDDSAAGPGVGGAAPLQSDEQADDACEEEGGAEDVELREALAPGEGAGSRVLVAVGDGCEEKEDDGEGDAADGEVDVEAPAPCHFCGEGAAYK